jgi:flagellar assembly protein FliH
MMIMSDAAVAKVDLFGALPKSVPFRPLMGLGLKPMHADHPQEKADAFSQGFDAGHRTATEALSEECAQLRALLTKAEALQHEPSEAVTALITETVLRLVTEIVGNAPVDQAMLEQRITQAMAVVTECDAARALVLHPDDHALLADCNMSLPLMVDPDMPRGDLRIDCAAGSIEHGVSLHLSALRVALGAEQ